MYHNFWKHVNANFLVRFSPRAQESLGPVNNNGLTRVSRGRLAMQRKTREATADRTDTRRRTSLASCGRPAAGSAPLVRAILRAGTTSPLQPRGEAPRPTCVRCPFPLPLTPLLPGRPRPRDHDPLQWIRPSFQTKWTIKGSFFFYEKIFQSINNHQPKYK
jgi:hypothetical protein